MVMEPYNLAFCPTLVELVEREVSERIDDAVRRVLRLKYRLGLFERPCHERNTPISRCNEAAAKVAADEAITLLKTRRISSAPAGARILVAGPNAHTMRPLNGGWSYSGKVRRWMVAEQYNTSTKPCSISSERVTSATNRVSYKMDNTRGECT